jgi:hypothetical protein
VPVIICCAKICIEVHYNLDQIIFSHFESHCGQVPPIKKLDCYSRQLFKEIFLNDSSKKPIAVLLGSTLGLKKTTPTSKLNKALSHREKIAYYRKVDLTDAGILSTGGKIMKLISFKNQANEKLMQLVSPNKENAQIHLDLNICRRY